MPFKIWLKIFNTKTEKIRYYLLSRINGTEKFSGKLNGFQNATLKYIDMLEKNGDVKGAERLRNEMELE